MNFKPQRLFKLARSKAYLFSGVEIRWKSAVPDGDMPMEATFHFPGGLADYLNDTLDKVTTYFASLIGGASEMTLLAERKNARDRKSVV